MVSGNCSKTAFLVVCMCVCVCVCACARVCMHACVCVCLHVLASLCSVFRTAILFYLKRLEMQQMSRRCMCMGVIINKDEC